MFRLNHRSIKVTLFSEIHIKIISKISLTYHQIAFLYLWIKLLLAHSRMAVRVSYHLRLSYMSLIENSLSYIWKYFTIPPLFYSRFM